MMPGMTQSMNAWMPIGEFARRAGVSPDRLRKWEVRYGLFEPVRTTGNRRLYTRADLTRARLMLRHIGRGTPPARAAELTIAEVSELPSAPLRATIEQAAASATSIASFRSSFVPMLVADDQRRYVDVNPAACLLLRLSREEILRLRIDDLTPAGRADVTAALWEAFLRDGTQTGTFELGMPDGARLTVDYSAKANIEPGRHLSLLYLPASKRGSAPSGSGSAATEQLTDREREVLTLIAMGARGASIAVTLGVSRATVQAHVRRCLAKLGAKSRAHAIAIGLERGEITMRFGPPTS
jgi:DNA-binding CsgD family transcriptional regulator/DNA-binding transcriptional MerR regulator